MMPKANGRDRQNSYRFKPRQRNVPLEDSKEASSSSAHPNDNNHEADNPRQCEGKKEEQLPSCSGTSPQQSCSGVQAFKPIEKSCDISKDSSDGDGWKHVQKSKPGNRFEKFQVKASGSKHSENVQFSKQGPSEKQNKTTMSSPHQGKGIIVEGQFAEATFQKPKKKKPSKTERKKKREEKALNDLYRPKDSHFSVLSPELFHKLKSGAPTGAPSSPKPVIITRAVPGPPPIVSRSFLDDSFPTLSSSINLTPPPTPFQFTPLTTPTSPFPQIAEKKDDAVESEKKHSKPSSKRPIAFCLEEALSLAQTPLTGRVGKKQITRKTKLVPKENPKFTVGNLLDSSGPKLIHRGKIKAKKKKPSKLKRSILQSRKLRRSKFSAISITLNSLIDSSPFTDECDGSFEQIIEPQAAAGPVELKVSDNNQNQNTSIDQLDNLFKTLFQNPAKESFTEPLPQAVVELVKLEMHTRKFRPYCDMLVTKQFHGLVIPLLQELYRLQDRIYKTDPIKLQTKRRFVNGVKEVVNCLKLKKVQMVIIAPDIESDEGQGGLNEKLTEILSLAKEKEIPYVFSGNRFILGKSIGQKKSPVSVIAILDKQSTEELFNRVLEEAKILRNQYTQEFNRRVCDIMANGG